MRLAAEQQQLAEVTVIRNKLEPTALSRATLRP
jgi:hypothetical protein